MGPLSVDPLPLLVPGPVPYIQIQILLSKMPKYVKMYCIIFFGKITVPYLTRIATPSRVYLIDTGNEGRARESRHPPPHPPVDLFLTGGRDESR